MDVEHVAPALYERLGDRASTDLVALLDAKHQEWTTDVTSAVVERFERRLTEEISGVRVGLAQMEGALRAEIAGVRTEIADLRTEMHDGNAALRQETRDGDAALRQQLAALRQETRDGDAALRQQLAALRQEMRDGDAALRQEIERMGALLRHELRDGRNDLVKWSFVFWVGQFLAVGALLRMTGH
jgi:hypothetical protein